MKQKKRGLHVTINLTNRWLYALITIGILAIIGVGVYAYTGNVGHTSDQIDEADPTVLASVKDGITWAEISNRPAGLDDGDQVGITSETDPRVMSWAKTNFGNIEGRTTTVQPWTAYPTCDEANSGKIIHIQVDGSDARLFACLGNWRVIGGYFQYGWAQVAAG